MFFILIDLIFVILLILLIKDFVLFYLDTNLPSWKNYFLEKKIPSKTYFSILKPITVLSPIILLQLSLRRLSRWKIRQSQIDQSIIPKRRFKEWSTSLICKIKREIFTASYLTKDNQPKINFTLSKFLFHLWSTKIRILNREYYPFRTR